MVVNNWFVFTSAFMAVSGTRLAALFSLTFFIITNLVVLNVLMSLILDLSGNVREELMAAEADGSSGEKPKNTDYMHMIRHVLLHHDEDDTSANGGSPKANISSRTLARHDSGALAGRQQSYG